MNANRFSSDPFTGTWGLCLAESHFIGSPPQKWIQKIEASKEQLLVNEESVLDNGRCLNVTVAARFDGQDYLVDGSPLAESIAYTRLDRFTISGIAKRRGCQTMRETVLVSADEEKLIMRYSLRDRDGEETSQCAVFKRA